MSSFRKRSGETQANQLTSAVAALRAGLAGTTARSLSLFSPLRLSRSPLRLLYAAPRRLIVPLPSPHPALGEHPCTRVTLRVSAPLPLKPPSRPVLPCASKLLTLITSRDVFYFWRNFRVREKPFEKIFPVDEIKATFWVTRNYRIHIILEIWIGFKDNYVSMAEVTHELLLQNIFLLLLNLFRVLECWWLWKWLPHI